MSVQTLARPAVPVPLRRLWSRDEYHRAHALGLFEPGERLELIRGEIIEKMPQKPFHATALSLSLEALYDLARSAPNVSVRCQLPISLPGSSEPEPDLAVVRGSARDYQSRHPEPEEILLIVEVSDTTLSFDRTDKANLYAEAGIVEYWVLNVTDRLVEIRRDPASGEYRTLQTVLDTGSLAPLFAPTELVNVVDLLPRPE